MYLLFRYHHIMPHQIKEMGFGEWQIVKAFIHYQMEKLSEEIESMKKN